MRIFPNKIQRDLLLRTIGPFLLAFTTIMFLLLMQFLIQHIDKLVGKGLPFGVVIELILTNLAYMVVLAVPMSILVSTLMVFGRFSETNEYTALRAGGISPFRCMSPIIVFGLLVSVTMVWFSNEVLPEANLKARSLFIDIRLKKPGFDLKENVFYNGVSGYTFLVKKVNSETDSLYDVTLFQEAGLNRDFTVFKSKTGILKSEEDGQTLTLFLYSGSVMRKLSDREGKKRWEETRFSDYRISFDLSDLSFSRSNPTERTRNDRTMSAAALLAVADTLTIEKTLANKTFLVQTPVLLAKKPIRHNPTTQSAQIGDLAVYKANASRIEKSKTSTLQKPIQTEWIALNRMETLKKQTDVTFRAVKAINTNISRINSHMVSQTWKDKRIARYMVEYHKKYAIPVGCLIFVLIGAPIGLMTRKGNLGVAALISAVTFTYYWICIIQGEKLADRLFVSPVLGTWFGDITMGLLGLYLTFYVLTDGQFFKPYVKSWMEKGHHKPIQKAS